MKLQVCTFPHNKLNFSSSTLKDLLVAVVTPPVLTGHEEILSYWIARVRVRVLYKMPLTVAFSLTVVVEYS